MGISTKSSLHEGAKARAEARRALHLALVQLDTARDALMRGDVEDRRTAARLGSTATVTEAIRQGLARKDHPNGWQAPTRVRRT